MTPMLYINGEFVTEPDAKISVYNGGWLHGAGLFETMRAENGKVFRLESHIGRLRRSAETLLSPIPREELPDHDSLADLLRRNALRSARIRLTVTAGSMRDGGDPQRKNLIVCAAASALGGYDAKLYEDGVGVLIARYQQSPTDPLAGHKTTAYLARLIALRDAHAGKCAEALWFTTENRLAEGSISNVFIVRDGVIATPPLDTPVLPGIARAIVLETLAPRAELKTDERIITIDDLLDADEVFLTNSIMQVLPVVRIEKREIGEGRVGPVAKRLFEAYRDLVKKECAGE